MFLGVRDQFRLGLHAERRMRGDDDRLARGQIDRLKKALESKREFEARWNGAKAYRSEFK